MRSVYWRCLAALAVLTLGLNSVPAVSETLSASQTNGPKQWNVILVLSDDQRMFSVGKMPYLMSRPAGSWVRFKRAFLSTPLCCPTRATLLKGRYAHEVNVRFNDGRRFKDKETLAVWLRRAGYRTGFVGKYLNKYPFGRGASYIPPGWDRWYAQLTPRVSNYYNYSLNENGRVRQYGASAHDYLTDTLSRKAVRFVQGVPEGKPFFLMLAHHAPHSPITPAPRHIGRYSSLPYRSRLNYNEQNVSDKPRWVRRLHSLQSEDHSQMATAYRQEAEAMLAVDDSMRALVGALRDKGQLKRTVIIYMTDNGMSAGSHRWKKKRCPYEECIRTPLLVRYPPASNRVAKRLVSSIDIAPTIAALGGATAVLPPDGRNLLPLLQGKQPPWRSGVLLALRQWGKGFSYWAVRTKRWKYVALDSGEKELYDLWHDHYELHNKAGRPAYTQQQQRLHQLMKRLRGWDS